MARDIYQYAFEGDKPVERFIRGLDRGAAAKALEEIEAVGAGERKFIEPYVKIYNVKGFGRVYEMRPKMVKPVRILFRVSDDDGAVILLHAYLKRRDGDAQRALGEARQCFGLIRDKAAKLDLFNIKEYAGGKENGGIQSGKDA
jgi:hypothetical protein